MSDKDSVLLSLRFFDINDPTANAPVPSKTDEDYSRNTYFKVRKHSKFGSLVKKFAQISNHNPYDLTFYHLKRFMNPANTITELKLKNEDQILVKKLIPLTVHFTKDNSLKKEQFVVLKDTVTIKVEEDCVVQSVYQILATHLQIPETVLKSQRYSPKSFEFFQIKYAPGQVTTTKIENLAIKLNKLGISANDHIVIKCDDVQYKFFSEKVNGPSVNTDQLDELRNEIQKLTEKNKELSNKNKSLLLVQQNTEFEKSLQQNLSKAQEELKSTNNVLSKKLVLINTLQNEKKKLSDEVLEANNELNQKKTDIIEKNKQILELVSKLDSLKSSLVTSTNDYKTLHDELNAKVAQISKARDEESLAKRALEKQLAENETLFKTYVTKIYNEYGLYLQNYSKKIKVLLDGFRNLVEQNVLSHHLALEINLDPIDFDYLEIIIKSTKMPENFLALQPIDFQKVVQQLVRPKPQIEYFNDKVLYSIFEILYEKDTGVNGLTVREITDFAKDLDTSVVVEKIMAYLGFLSQKETNVYYGLQKRWSAEKRLSVYVYDQIVDWNFVGNTNSFKKLATNQLQTVSDAFKTDVFKDLKLDKELENTFHILEAMKLEVESRLVPSTINAAKNLLNVLGLIKDFKRNEQQFQEEKQQMVEHFKSQLQNAADKVSFVSTYSTRLESLAGEIERLKQEKIQFENDNDLYEKFKDFGVQRPKKAIQELTWPRAPWKSIAPANYQFSPVHKENNVAQANETLLDGGNVTSTQASVPANTRKRLISVGDSFNSMSHVNINETASAALNNKTDVTLLNGTSELPVTNNTTTAINTDSILTGGITYDDLPAAKRFKPSDDTEQDKATQMVDTYNSQNTNALETKQTEEPKGPATEQSHFAAKEDDVYLNIKIELADNTPVFFKIKKTTKLKRVLKSYKLKLANNSAARLSKKEIDNLQFAIAGTTDLDYNLKLQDLNLRNYSIVTATVGK